MVLQSSGALSFSNIQTEFGGTNPISLSEYYGKASGIPASGTISLSNFLGKGGFSALGGTVSTWSTYKIHTFTTSLASGSAETFTFTVNGTGTVEYFIVAGGGGGGGGIVPGGGGAGGWLAGSTTVNTGNYSIVVSSGGTAFNPNAANYYLVGGTALNSSAFGFTAYGGGGGGPGTGASANLWGLNGGSGGGGGGFSNYDNSPAYGYGGSGTSGQGYGGGNSWWNNSKATAQWVYGGGGGGGLGAGGTTQPYYSPSLVPNGGQGIVSGITGTNVTYCVGGGGAQAYWSGSGFSNYTSGSFPTAKGSGGRGISGQQPQGTPDSSGMPGIVVIRYPA